MVIVIDPVLVEGGRPGGLNTPDESLLGQHTECVVHRLTRDGSDLSFSDLGHTIGRDVRLPRNRPQHGQALSSDLDVVLAKKVGGAEGHAETLYENLE